jgi:hypothetical protein
MIVWVSSYPRSGNTMVRLLLKQGYGFHCKSIYDETRSVGRIRSSEWIRRIEGTITDIEALRIDAEVHFLKTHELPTDDEPAICIVRDGRDAVVSYAHFLRQYDPESVVGLSWEEVLEKVVIGDVEYGGWSHHVDSWSNRVSPTILLRYEDLLDRPFPLLASALDALDVSANPTGERPPEFSELHEQVPEFFRKGTAGSWMEEMSPQLAELFMLHHETTMWSMGYTTDITREEPLAPDVEMGDCAGHTRSDLHFQKA